MLPSRHSYQYQEIQRNYIYTHDVSFLKNGQILNALSAS
jgi:hypothetical protein